MDADSKRVAQELIGWLEPLGGSTRAMFGGYCVYVDGKPVGLVNDGSIFVKRSSAEGRLAGLAELGPAYPGAKDSWRLTPAALEAEPLRVVAAIHATAAALPPRRERAQGRPPTR
jgi:TfoX/Sxy family transcriptional regulator of competence genes